MEENETVIEIKDLVKKYKMYIRKKDRLVEAIFPKCNRHSDFMAMDHLNLEVKKGEVLGILGKNGAGKSTLLKMITGVVVPSSGTLNIKGSKISSLLELGTAFNMELTGIENIYQHGQVMGLTQEEIEKTKQDVIDFADIGDHLYQPVKTYSSGMFARLAFACAINVNPDILIVDEVLSVGDMAFQLKCFKKFEEFKAKGKTILFVTHSVGAVLDNCTRVIILEQGKKIFDGDTKEGVENYKKLITGMLEKNKKEEKKETKEIKVDKSLWKSNFNLNPDVIIYGNKEAEIIDYGIFNSKNEYESIIDSEDEICIKMKAKFYKDVECPTFSITIKDFTGKEICGTNTNIQKIYTGKCKSGKKYICEFRQKLKLAPGKYTLSLSCSKYNANGELIPINRNYDALIFEVISKKPVVGYYEFDTDIKFDEIK